MERIIQYPSAQLRRTAPEVDPHADTTAGAVRRLLRAAVIARPTSVGLAAPQLGINARIIAVRPAPRGRFTVVINPTFTATTQTTEVAIEHCLSVDGGRRGYPVARCTAGVLHGWTSDGEEFEQPVEEFLARVVQHEIDHLDGVSIPDRAQELEVAA